MSLIVDRLLRCHRNQNVQSSNRPSVQTISYLRHGVWAFIGAVCHACGACKRCQPGEVTCLPSLASDTLFIMNFESRPISNHTKHYTRRMLHRQQNCGGWTVCNICRSQLWGPRQKRKTCPSPGSVPYFVLDFFTWGITYFGAMVPTKRPSRIAINPELLPVSLYQLWDHAKRQA